MRWLTARGGWAKPPGMSGALERNAVLAYLDRRIFEHIQVSEGWLRAVREAAARGAVVYVLRNESLVDVLALERLVHRFGLPPIRFAQDTNLGLLEPLGRGWFSSLLPRGETVAQRLERAIEGGGGLGQGAQAGPFRPLTAPGRLLCCAQLKIATVFGAFLDPVADKIM